MIDRFRRDTFVNGILLGILSIMLNYILFLNIDRLINMVTSLGHILKAPRLQLVILAINIILFRFLMVRWQRVETGKGLLMVIVLAAATYFLMNRQLLRNSL